MRFVLLALLSCGLLSAGKADDCRYSDVVIYAMVLRADAINWEPTEWILDDAKSVTTIDIWDDEALAEAICQILDATTQDELVTLLDGMIRFPREVIQDSYQLLVEEVKGGWYSDLKSSIDVMWDILPAATDIGFPDFPLDATYDEILAIVQYLFDAHGPDVLAIIPKPSGITYQGLEAFTPEIIASAFSDASRWQDVADYLGVDREVFGRYMYDIIQWGDPNDDWLGKLSIYDTFSKLVDAAEDEGLFDLQ